MTAASPALLPLEWPGAVPRLTGTSGHSTLRWAALAIALLPVLTPAGPGQVGPVDGALVGVIVVAVLWARHRNRTFPLPFGVSMGLFIVAGGMGLIAARAPVTDAVALAQDLFLLLAAGAVATIAFDAAAVRTLVRAWAVTAVAWAAVLVVAVAFDLSVISGQTDAEGTRAALTFGDPNRAGSFFACSTLVLLASDFPRRRIARWTAVAVVICALFVTGSLAGAAALVAGLAFAFVVAAQHQGLGPIAVVALSLAAMAGAVAVATVDVRAVVQSAQRASPLLENSIGRSAQSAESRGTLFSENLRLYEHGSLLGVGASRTEETLAASQAPYVKEAHSDYAAALIERGVAGAAALLLLGVAVAARCGLLCRRPPRAGSVPRPYFLVAAVVAVAVNGVFHEVLHFRHVWVLLGLLAAASALQRDSVRSGGI